MTDLILKSTRSDLVPRDSKRRKVKSGCRTCKVRKVKCDEGWPICRVCLSTGRICDGYGIWGGGGNRYEQRRIRDVTAEPMNATRSDQSAKLLFRRSLFPSTIPVSNTEEYLHFEFFKDETLSKLPGVYGRKYNNVWEVLVLQACAEEPAVMHAVLAISSAHRRKVLDGVSRNRVLLYPDRQEEFLLRNYCKSIEHLQRRYHICGEHSLRTTLITCLVFIYLELLRGNYKRACDHLDSGTKLLRSLQLETNTKNTRFTISSTNSSLSSGQNGVDGFLKEAFTRLRAQIMFCNQRCGTGSNNMPKFPSDLPVCKFSSHHEACHYLDRVFEGVTRLSQAMRDDTHTNWPTGYWEMVKTERCLIRGSLDSWQWSYNATIADVISAKDDDKLSQYQMLHIYHTMAEIMAGTCLSPVQSIFDQYSSEFLSIISQSNNIALNSDSDRKIVHSNPICPDPCRRAWPDVNWIPPLYYTALKCRVHEIRAQAIELMPSFWRYEIVWDLGILNMASTVAEEVIRMEEGDFFKIKDQRSDEEIQACEDVEYKLRPLPLPEERRFDTVEMIRPDDVPGRIQIVCKKRNEGQWQINKKIYDEMSGTWSKAEQNTRVAQEKYA